MAIKRLDEKLNLIDDLLNLALSNYSNPVDKQLAIGKVSSEFKKLRMMLDGLSSFVEHRWQVMLVFGKGVVSEKVDINAEHLEAAREVAISMMDKFDSAIDYELYCDGKLIPAEN